MFFKIWYLNYKILTFAPIFGALKQIIIVH